MPQSTKLQINNRIVLSSELNYDDLIILYELFISTYGRTPSQRDCLSKYNMPTLDMVYRVLNNNNITYADFIKRFNDKTTRSLNVNIQTKKNKDKFPITINKTTYNISGDVEIIHKDSNRNSYYLDLVDNMGYEYNYSYNAVMAAYKNQKELNRFFKRNKYTYDNINLYCKLNNIDLQIDGENLPVTGYAREIVDFRDGNGNIIKTSWNHISSSKVKFRTINEKVKIKNKMYMSKEKASKIIHDVQNNLNRPLLQSDFEGVTTSDTSVGIRVICRIWGTFNNMIDDLCLLKHDKYYKPNSSYYIPHDDILRYIDVVCNTVKNEGRNIVTTKDFKNIVNIVDIRRIRNHCKLENIDFYSVISKHGCKIQDAGNGLNHKFDDGERVVSQYEYDFSMFLRKNGLVYNKDYFRDIKYNTIDNQYSGGMNCDYKIIINDHIIFVELAGILGNKQHQEAYRNNTPLKSKSKETYRQKLNLKREIFERNNLNYYILLPDEMNEETYKKISSKHIKEVA